MLVGLNHNDNKSLIMWIKYSFMQTKINKIKATKEKNITWRAIVNF